ncbi:MAG TPA: hypothetical protein RMH99_33080 [Sandaracinaceae bacterium LLY-WYZ-13_1]|nr:hypothetical protein [Sandaracinaceae bacterium LLY-WYZ-13_1]
MSRDKDCPAQHADDAPVALHEGAMDATVHEDRAASATQASDGTVSTSRVIASCAWPSSRNGVD